MSKHEKHVRRERRKSDRGRRERARTRTDRHPTSHIKHGAAALAAAAVIAAGTSAYAAPVRFDNPAHGDAGHFHWAGATPEPTLDVTLPAGSQPGDYLSPTALSQSPIGGQAGFHSYYPYAGMRVQAVSHYYSSFMLGFNAGDIIPNPSGFYDYYGQIAFTGGGYLYPGYYGAVEGAPMYFGLQIGGFLSQYDGTAQFGWIGGVLNAGEFEVFAWAYETEVMTPITIPEPGSLALLAFGAVAVLRRKRPA